MAGYLLPFTKLTGVRPGKEGKPFRSAAEAQLWNEKYSLDMHNIFEIIFDAKKLNEYGNNFKTLYISQ